MPIICPLCGNKSEFLCRTRNRDYYKCLDCLSVFMDPQITFPKEAEKERYEKHLFDEDDAGYLAFAAPLIEEACRISEAKHRFLDFGSGRLSAISKVLSNKGFSVAVYDPFFHDDKEILKKTFDRIICCEVIEHFARPAEEFALLKSLLKPEGKLICMTALYSEEIDFASWHYKNDFTHRFFYHKNAIVYIKNKFHYNNVRINERIIVFS